MSLIENNVTLEKITGTDSQIRVLYDMLINRTHNISNTLLPSFKEHVNFVRNHPYRIWYLIKRKSSYIGAAYILKNNCVGVNLNADVFLFGDVVKKILEQHRPLKEIKSVRPAYFFINIAPDNKEVEIQLGKINAQKIQSTFVLKSM